MPFSPVIKPIILNLSYLKRINADMPSGSHLANLFVNQKHVFACVILSRSQNSTAISIFYHFLIFRSGGAGWQCRRVVGIIRGQGA